MRRSLPSLQQPPAVPQIVPSPKNVPTMTRSEDEASTVFDRLGQPLEQPVGAHLAAARIPMGTQMPAGEAEK